MGRQGNVPRSLFSLCDDIWILICTVYLRLPDLCRLDSAIGNIRLRKWFLTDILGSRNSMFLRENPLCSDTAFCLAQSSIHGPLPGSGAMKWIHLRRLHLATLFMPPATYPLTDESMKVRNILFDLIGSNQLDRLEIIDINRSCLFLFPLSDLIGGCYKTLKILDVRLDTMRGDQWFHESVQMQIVIMAKCKKLIAFAASGYESMNTIEAVVVNNPDLRVFVFGPLTPTYAVLSVINACHKLEHVVMSGVTKIGPSCLWRRYTCRSAISSSAALSPRIGQSGTCADTTVAFQLCFWMVALRSITVRCNLLGRISFSSLTSA